MRLYSFIFILILLSSAAFKLSKLQNPSKTLEGTWTQVALANTADTIEVEIDIAIGGGSGVAIYVIRTDSGTFNFEYGGKKYDKLLKVEPASALDMIEFVFEDKTSGKRHQYSMDLEKSAEESSRDDGQTDNFEIIKKGKQFYLKINGEASLIPFSEFTDEYITLNYQDRSERYKRFKP